MRMFPSLLFMRGVALLAIFLLLPGIQDGALLAQQAQPDAQSQPKLAPDQLDSLVAPIALYPDPLLGQVLAASVYPLEIVEAARWVKANPTLKDTALTDAAKKQDWDPAVQALVVFPDAMKLLDDNLKWTTDLGNAFLAQQEDVMAAIQRMRTKAKDSGKLQSTKEQKVATSTADNKTIIEIQPASPQVIYVPSYNPTVVWGTPPVYVYPPIVYPPPPTTGELVATGIIAFSAGIALGAAFGGCCGYGGWGWGCGWSHNTVVINNNFYNRYNFNNRVYAGNNRINNINGNRNFQVDPNHRRGVPYPNKELANRYGGVTRNDPRVRNAQSRSGQLGSGGGGVQRQARGNTPARSPQTRPRAQQARSRASDHTAFGGMDHGNQARAHSDRGHASMGSRGFSRGGGGFGGRGGRRR
jgi:hypothetical protein